MSHSFIITGTHVEVTPALDKYAREKLSKVEKIVDHITSIKVTLSVDKLQQKAEAEVHISGDAHGLFAESVTDDLYKSIDALEDKLLHQARKYHEKLTEKRHGDSRELEEPFA